LLSKAECKNLTKKNGWKFNWLNEHQIPEREVYKLTITNNAHIIQGLISLEVKIDHVYMHLIESAPFNIGRNKVYLGVPGNLVSFACKLSFQRGGEGYVSFLSKTKLIGHYEKSLGAVHSGGGLIVIKTEVALKLTNKYFLKNMGLIKEPLEVDLVVDPRPLTKAEQQAISAFIRADKDKRNQKKMRSSVRVKRKSKKLK
jgi:hypothetical protein